MNKFSALILLSILATCSCAGKKPPRPQGPTGPPDAVAIETSNATATVTVAPGTQIVSLGTIVGGSGYTNGSYPGTSLTGGSGTLATANITVAGGKVTVVTVVNPGSGYKVGDTLSATIPGGSGFTIPVAALGGTFGQDLEAPRQSGARLLWLQNCI